MTVSDSSSESSSDHGFDDDNFNDDAVCTNCKNYRPCRCVHITENPYELI